MQRLAFLDLQRLLKRLALLALLALLRLSSLQRFFILLVQPPAQRSSRCSGLTCLISSSRINRGGIVHGGGTRCYLSLLSERINWRWSILLGLYVLIQS